MTTGLAIALGVMGGFILVGVLHLYGIKQATRRIAEELKKMRQNQEGIR